MVFTLGAHFHKISQGWVTFLAPGTPKAGLRYPGSDVPLAIPADRNLVFFVYPNQSDYLPWLEGLYPGGVLKPVRGRGGEVWFTPTAFRETRGGRPRGRSRSYPDGRTARVDRLGETPAGPGRPLAGPRRCA